MAHQLEVSAEGAPPKHLAVYYLLPEPTRLGLLVNRHHEEIFSPASTQNPGTVTSYETPRTDISHRHHTKLAICTYREYTGSVPATFKAKIDNL